MASKIPDKLPENQQVIKAVGTIHDKLEETKHDEKIDKTGEKLINTTEAILIDAAQILQQKNPDNKIQEIIKETQKMYEDMSGTNKKWGEMKRAFNTVDSEELKQNLLRLQENARLLLMELVRSSEFRNDLSDLMRLLYNFMVFTGDEKMGSMDAREVLEKGKAKLERGKEKVKEVVGGTGQTTGKTKGVKEKGKEVVEKGKEKVREATDTKHHHGEHRPGEHHHPEHHHATTTTTTGTTGTTGIKEKGKEALEKGKEKVKEAVGTGEHHHHGEHRTGEHHHPEHHHATTTTTGTTGTTDMKEKGKEILEKGKEKVKEKVRAVMGPGTTGTTSTTTKTSTGASKLSHGPEKLIYEKHYVKGDTQIHKTRKEYVTSEGRYEETIKEKYQEGKHTGTTTRGDLIYEYEKEIITPHGFKTEKFISRPGEELHEKHKKQGIYEEKKRDHIKKEGGKEYIEHLRSKTDEGRTVTDVSTAIQDESGRIHYEHKVYTDPHIPGHHHHPDRHHRGIDDLAGYQTDEREYTKQEMIDQLNKVLRSISNRKRGQETFSALVDTIRIVAAPTKTLGQESKKASNSIIENPHFKNIVTLSQELFYSITNYNPNRMSSIFRKLYHSVRDDRELEEFVRDLFDFFEDQLKHPEKIGTEKSSKQLGELYDRGRRVSRGKHNLKRYMNKMMEEMHILINKMQKDSLFNETQNDIQKLVSLLVLDEKGNFAVKPDIFRQLKNILFVTLVQNFKYPLPEIKVDKGPSLKLRLRGIVFSIQDILPEKMEAHNTGNIALDLSDLNKKGQLPDIDKAREVFTISLKHMNVKIPSADIDFTREKFPKVDDSGMIDITVGGDGLDILLTLVVDKSLSSDKMFDLQRVECDLHDLDIKMSYTKHDKLYNAMIKVLKPVLKRNVETAVEENIRKVLLRVNDQIVAQKEVIKTRVQHGVQKAKEVTGSEY